MTGRIGVDRKGRFTITRRPDDSPTVLRVLERIERDTRAGKRFPPTEQVLRRLIDSARRDDGLPTQAMLARLQILAAQCGLTRQDRLELAEVLLRRDVASWGSFTLREAELMGAALEGFGLIAVVQAEQGRRWRFGACPAGSCPMRSPGASAGVLTDRG